MKREKKKQNKKLSGEEDHEGPDHGENDEGKGHDEDGEGQDQDEDKGAEDDNEEDDEATHLRRRVEK